MSQSNKNVPVFKIPNCERIQQIGSLFNSEFGVAPQFFVRVPGRVNIIGEHIDYCGYPVLPMALEQDILIAAACTEGHLIQIRNTSNKYTGFEIGLDVFDNIEIKPDENGKPFWYNYVLCGIKGALEFLKYNYKNGLQMYVDGNIPPASGLSSSSALVSAACLAFLYSHQTEISKNEIASLCANCERYIGTQGGGMDQAIAFLAEKYCAQYITWQPLNASPITLPEEAAFVVAHSLAEANKAATNDFNRRVVECRLAAKVLLKKCDAISDLKVKTLSQVQNELGYNLEQMIQLVKDNLPKDVYTKDEICDILNINSDQLEKIYLSDNTRHLEEFKLKQRALHVYEEALRVEKFRNACIQMLKNGNGHTNAINGSYFKNGESSSSPIETLGKLMLESHESLQNLYECSHENLDLLVKNSKENNVYSRLTGAGWGGCVVALCPKDRVQDYIEKLKVEFYDKHCNVSNDLISTYIFATTPNHGAVIYNNNINNI